METNKKNIFIALGIIASIALIALLVVFIGRDNTKDIPGDVVYDDTHEVATFAGGCFWCIEALLQETAGVSEAISGYIGGQESTAKYPLVSTGATKHREAVQITFDPETVSYQELVELFFTRIDPTDNGGQFSDRGHHYTTAIYYHSPEQQQAAERVIQNLNNSGKFDTAVVTEVLEIQPFYPAEDYHQDYYLKSSEAYKQYEENSGRAGYIKEVWPEDDDTTETSAPTPRDDYDYTDEEIEEMLKDLDPLAYHVIAEEGTEQPFNNAYWDNKADGIYVDKVTKKPLFSSTPKYDSGTGWPSFWRTIDDDSVTLHEDNSLSIARTEVRSDAGHIGHLFNDGPVKE